MNAFRVSLLAFVMASLPAVSAGRPVVSKIGQTALVFLDASESSSILRQKDDFISALTVYDILSTVPSDRPATIDSYLSYIGDQTLDWRPSQRRVIRDIFSSIARKTCRYNLRCPDTLFAVKTTGLELDSALYTRANAIIVPEGAFELKRSQLEPRIIHQLFHVISRNDPALRERLFNIVHYRRCPPLRIPAAYRTTAITNPDYPIHDYYTSGTGKDSLVDIIPVTIARQHYGPAAAQSRWRARTTKFLVVQRTVSETAALCDNDGPVVAGFDQRPENNFVRYKNIWSKTYCPETIMAEYFAMMVQDDTTTVNQWVVDSMRTLFME